MKFKCPWCGHENININRTYVKEIEETTECSECGCHYQLRITYMTLILVRGGKDTITQG